jgi:hypothetical protein
VNHIERSTEIPSPSPRAGCFATLRGPLSGKGSGAPFARPRLAVTALGVALCLALLVPVDASAHFSRPFLRQITGTCEKAEESPPSCAGSKFVPFGGPGEIAVDGEDDLWVLEGRGGVGETNVDEFGPSGVYRQTLEPPSLNSAEYLAIGSTGALYVSSHHAVGNAGYHQVEIFSKTGVLEKTFAPSEKRTQLGHQALAVDDSTDPLDLSAGDVYVYGGYQQESLQKFNAAGEPVDWESFKGSESCGCGVSGNEIFFAIPGPDAVAVDPANGDIWVAGGDVQGQGGQGVREFSPGGELIREVTGDEAPGLGEGRGFNGGEKATPISGLAVDPTNGDLLVSLVNAHDEGVVDEFDAEGTFLGQITEAEGEPLRGAFGLAVDSHGDLYVVNHNTVGEEVGQSGGPHVVDEFEAGHFVPRVRPVAATQRKQSSAVLNGFVDPESDLNPEKEGITDCQFEYVSETAFQKTGFEELSSGGKAPCEHPDAGEIPRNNAETPVHALVSGHIESGVTYRYRLSVTVGGKLGGSLDSAAAVFTAAHAPHISATAASDVTSTFAQLSAYIDPLGSDTTYQFQYLPEEQFKRNGESFAGAAVAPTALADIGSGGEAGDLVEAVGEQVGGLEPATTYRFRVVASNEAGVSEGEATGGGEVAHVFTTEPAVSVGLPDGRAYELVTPPDKEGAEDMFGEASFNLGASSESGDQFLLETRAAFGSFPGSGVSVYVFSRHPVAGHPGEEEWGYTSLTSPVLGEQNLDLGVGAIEPVAFSKVAVNDTVGAPASEAGIALTSLVGVPGGPYTTLHTDQFTHEVLHGGIARGFPWERTEVIGASRDLGVVVVRSDNPALVEGGRCQADVCSEPLLPNLYVWAGGEFGRLAVQSDGEPIGSCGAALGSGRIGVEQEDADDGAVSADGSKVFFTAPILPDEVEDRRLEGVKGCTSKTGENQAELYMRSGEETIEVSAPEEGATEHRAAHEAVFFGASEDGSRVFFTSEGELTANDKGIHDMELYEYDTETGKLTRVSAGDSGDAAGDVVPLGQSKGESGTGFLKDVVVSSDGSHVYFVARGVLAPANAEGKTPVEGEENLYVYDTQTGRTAFIAKGNGSVAELDEYATPPETTPDGRFLLFQGGMLGRGSPQLYRYDAGTEGLACVSCGPGFSSGVALVVPLAIGDAVEEKFPAHAIAEDGSVFFNTEASLVPQDTNGVLDVYEWHEGEISLLSSGQDPLPSDFLGASPNGANVFFGTHARLVPADTSGGGNVYDARVCTASEPCIAAAPAREGLCEGDACSHPAAAPSDATPASATFTGPGDLVPVPSTAPRAKSCAKPKKLSHGRCVSAKPKRRKAKLKARSRQATARKATRSDRGGKHS